MLSQLRLDAEERVTRSREALDSTREQVARLSEIEHEVKGQLDSVNEQLEFSQQQCEEFKVKLPGGALFVNLIDCLLNFIVKPGCEVV